MRNLYLRASTVACGNTVPLASIVSPKNSGTIDGSGRPLLGPVSLGDAGAGLTQRVRFLPESGAAEVRPAAARGGPRRDTGSGARRSRGARDRGHPLLDRHRSVHGPAAPQPRNRLPATHILPVEDKIFVGSDILTRD